MESRAFIIAAKELMVKIEDGRNTVGTAAELQNQRETLQKEVNQLFSGLQNPSLMTAISLRDAAMRHGFHIPVATLNRLAQFE